ncbi:hypothetical protein WR25_06207 [Diploscapter pachys]|uniref:C2H2-type domain-containing protein n=1 Tax=Diploscapter pachys TaxID=2018661 RepID=A0A2A2L440_9BILA|nr:hypothetical protein WR25_06207 [Diploscapter pachys]
MNIGEKDNFYRKVYNPTNNNIVCSVCKQKTFGKDQDFLYHLRRHNEYRLKDLECDIPECIFRTDTKAHLQQHMKHKHGDPKSSDEIERRECGVTRKDGKKCTFYAYTLKEITKHREYELYSHITQE